MRTPQCPPPFTGPPRSPDPRTCDCHSRQLHSTSLRLPTSPISSTAELPRAIVREIVTRRDGPLFATGHRSPLRASTTGLSVTNTGPEPGRPGSSTDATNSGDTRRAIGRPCHRPTIPSTDHSIDRPCQVPRPSSAAIVGSRRGDVLVRQPASAGMPTSGTFSRRRPPRREHGPGGCRQGRPTRSDGIRGATLRTAPIAVRQARPGSPGRRRPSATHCRPHSSVCARRLDTESHGRFEASRRCSPTGTLPHRSRCFT